MAGFLEGRPDPLKWGYPSPMLLVNFPLFAMNVKLLSQQDGWRTPAGSSALTTTFVGLRLTYRTEGLLGIYRGGHLYLLHQVTKELLRLLASRTFSRLVEPWVRRRHLRLHGDSQEEQVKRQLFWSRTLTKYGIDVVCYPILFASTRVIILPHDPPESTWQRLCFWCREEGPLAIFGGLLPSLISSALDEVMDAGLSQCIEVSSAGHQLEVPDKLLLKASAVSAMSILTTPVNYVSVIHRCQSSLPGLVERCSLSKTIQSLPWKHNFFQLLLFTGILALNVKLIQIKLATQSGDDDE